MICKTIKLANMFISDKTVQEFKKVFKKEYNAKFTDAQAREAATNLVGFFDLLMQIDSRIKKEKKCPKHDL